jgi:hypothetical protein
VTQGLSKKRQGAKLRCYAVAFSACAEVAVLNSYRKSAASNRPGKERRVTALSERLLERYFGGQQHRFRAIRGVSGAVPEVQQ